MTLATHALVGAVIGKNIDSPLIIVLISLIFHYAMDILRHGDYYVKKRTFFQGFIKEFSDLLIAGVLLFSVSYINNFSKMEIRLMLWGAGWSLVPDLLTLIYKKFDLKFLGGIYKFSRWIHNLFYTNSERAWTLKNLSNDFIISALAVITLLFF